MATDLRGEQAPSVASLGSGIIEDAQELLIQQFELFKQEVRADVRRIKVATQVLGFGAGLGLVGSLLLGVTCCLLLQDVAPALPLWACFALVGGIFLTFGGGVYAVGMALLSRVNPLPEQTAAALKENVQWLTKLK
jgi:hypothetical protein